MMKTYCFNSAMFTGDPDDSDIIELNEQEILDIFWRYWKEKMIKKFGSGHELITSNVCIEDYVICNWGWEKPSTNCSTM